MHLLPCRPPTSQLEPAPRSALRADSAQERWEGYWSLADETYFARCVRTDGSDQWYRISYDELAPNARDARVLVLRPPGVSRGAARMTVFGRHGQRTVLVGSVRRRVRVRRDAEGRR